MENNLILKKIFGFVLLVIGLASCSIDKNPENYQSVSPSYIHKYIKEPINIHEVENEAKAKSILKEIKGTKIKMTGEVYDMYAWKNRVNSHITMHSTKINEMYPRSSYHRTTIDYNFYFNSSQKLETKQTVTICGQIKNARAPIRASGFGNYTHLNIDVYNCFLCD